MKRVLGPIAFSLALAGCGAGDSPSPDEYRDGTLSIEEREPGAEVNEEEIRAGVDRDLQILSLEETWASLTFPEKVDLCDGWNSSSLYQDEFVAFLSDEWPDWNRNLTVDFFDTKCEE